MQVVVSYDFLFRDGSTVPFFSMKSLYQLRKYFRDGEAEIVQYCDKFLSHTAVMGSIAMEEYDLLGDSKYRRLYLNILFLF